MFETLVVISDVLTSWNGCDFAILSGMFISQKDSF